MRAMFVVGSFIDMQFDRNSNNVADRTDRIDSVVFVFHILHFAKTSYALPCSLVRLCHIFGCNRIVCNKYR